MQSRAEICITKKNIMSRFQLSPEAAHGRIKRALKKGSLLLLKKGLYLNADIYSYESNRIGLIEFIASRLHPQSYISLEYALQKYQMLPTPPMGTKSTENPTLRPQNAIHMPSSTHKLSTSFTALTPTTHKLLPPNLTLITKKQTKLYKNFVGNFIYKNIKTSCYFGFEEAKFRDQTYLVATKAKALFDYLYLRPEFGPRNEKYLSNQLFQKSKLQWENFSEEDFKQFDSYVWKSNSFKMMRLLRVIEQYFENKKFDAWKKELLSE